jgi:VWFA-related protein
MDLKRTLGIWTGAMVLAGTATLVAQSDQVQPAPPSAVFGERTEVEVVNLEVMVTDAAGNPVRGLTAADFEVLRDGDPVAISNFYAVEAGVSILPVQGAATPPAGEPPAVERVDDPDRRLNFILFVDQTNIAPSNRKRVIRAVHDFLDQLPQTRASPWSRSFAA